VEKDPATVAQLVDLGIERHPVFKRKDNNTATKQESFEDV